MQQQVEDYLTGRRSELGRALGKPLTPASAAEGSAPLTDRERTYLREEALDLYWNELEWEHITDEEQLDEGPVPELAFPGFLAFIRGLLLRETLPSVPQDANPRPEVVEEILEFLARRVVELDASGSKGGNDAEEAARHASERAMTAGLVDVVLMQLHDIDPGDL